jgi:outer membrane protein OmpA-like peptidoglycan-associated protein
VALQGNILSLSGHAAPEWIEWALHRASMIAGVEKVDRAGLLSTDEFLLAQARKLLEPPAHVRLEVKNKVLTLAGHLPGGEYRALAERLSRLQGFAGVERSGLVDMDALYLDLKQRVERTILYFSEETQFSGDEEQRLPQLAEDIQQALALSRRLGRSTTVQITGYTDGLGTEQHNLKLSLARAHELRSRLETLGIAPERLLIKQPARVRFGEGKEDAQERKVVFTMLETEPDSKN